MEKGTLGKSEKGTVGKGTLGKGTLGKGTLGKGTVGGLLVLLTTFLSLQTSAGESLLLTTSRSDSSELSKFMLVSAQNSDVLGLTMDGGPLIKIETISQGVTTQDGYVPIPFRGKRYRKFVVLKAAGKLSAKEGGLIDILYLSNALTNGFSSLRISLERVGSKWQLYTSPDEDHRAFNHLNFVIGKIGINSVQASQKKMALPELFETTHSEFAFQ